MFEDNPFQEHMILRGDPAISPYTHDAVACATPDAVFRPKTVQEIKEMVRYCAGKKIPVTCCGSRTSMTGSSITDSGLLLSLENISGIADLDGNRGIVSVRPGTILGEMQHAVECEGFFYPPSPTSRNECTVGATLVINATGDTTFKYGTTRRYVQELTVITADGALRTLTRKNPPPPELKNRAGYFLDGEEIDLVIGSEGTLGIIVEARLRLFSGVPNFLTLMIPFPSNTDALQFIASHADSAHHADLFPRSMEYVDAAALSIMHTHPSFQQLPEGVQALVICQQEFADGAGENAIDAWFSVLSAVYTELQCRKLLDAVIVARTDAEQKKIAAWRHHIPATVAERHLELQKAGGGKVGSDWWVPLSNMLEMMQWMVAASDALGIPYIAFAHLGNGHPHVNYLTRTPDEKKRAQALVIESCKRAVAWGGGVAGEHGIGKLKRNLLAIQHPAEVIAQMCAIKRIWDPQGLLAPGNIFSAPNI